MLHLFDGISNRRLCRRGFTLIELLVVIIILAVLAAIVLPKFMDSSKRSKESSLRTDLKLLRDAVASFQNDTGSFPMNLSDLAAASAPAKGLESNGAPRDIVAADWHGPYVQSVPKDPISRDDFKYGTTSPDIGKVSSSATGNASNGKAYSTW